MTKKNVIAIQVVSSR